MLFLRKISVIQIFYQKTIRIFSVTKNVVLFKKISFHTDADFADPEIEIQMILVRFL